jgi:3-phosphoshikimate 1-carboxyvinyltransferase
MTTAPSIDVLIRTLRTPLAQMPRELELLPLPGPFDVSVRPPGSKSITNRVLLMAALSRGESEISGALLDADDARVMIDALRTLGATIDIEPASEGSSAAPLVRVVGTGGALRGGCTLNLNNAGTATRFLTAAACLADAPVVIDGNARMRQRPIGELVSMLRALGVRIDEMGELGCVPLRVHPGGFRAREIEVGVTQSSQFISALMLVAPLMPGGLSFLFGPVVTSPSYIQMSRELLERLWNGNVEERDVPGGSTLRVPSALPEGFEYEVEPDASGMTYFWGAAAAVPSASCADPSSLRDSIQGDAQFREVVMPSEQSGCVIMSSHAVIGADLPGPYRVDFTNMPDAAMSLAAVACFARGATVINGLRTLRVKETDRLVAMQTELAKVGVEARIFSTRLDARDHHEYFDEGIEITPPRGGIDCSPSAPRVEFDTYDDHRMAMSLAIIGLRRPNVVIRDPQCVAKTYPTFWRDWAALYESARSGGVHVDAG